MKQITYLLLLTVSFVHLFTANAETLDLNARLKKKGYRRGASVTILNQKGYSLRFSSGEGKRVPSYYNAVRLYWGNTLEVEAERPIKRLSFIFQTGGKALAPTAEFFQAKPGTLDANKGLWTGQSNRLLFSFLPPTGRYFSLVSLDIEYAEPGSGDEPGKPNERQTVNTIARLRALPSGTSVCLQLSRATVLFRHNDETFVQDDTGAFCLQLPTSVDLTREDLVAGDVCGTITSRQGMLCLTEVTDATLRRIGTQTLIPLPVPATDLQAHPCEWVSTTFTQGDGSLQMVDRFAVGTSVYDGARLEVCALVIPHNAHLQLCPIAKSDVTLCFYDDQKNIYGSASQVNVNIHRTLKANAPNTLCLPVSLSAQETERIFGLGTKVATYAGADETGIRFITTANSTIQAGRPYLVIPHNDVRLISTNATNLSPIDGSTAETTFIGVLQPVTPSANSLYLGSDGRLRLFPGNKSIRAFRAYFTLPSQFSGRPLLIDGIPTSVAPSPLLDGKTQETCIYDLSGRKLPRHMPLPKGYYIVEGRKVLIQ